MLNFECVMPELNGDSNYDHIEKIRELNYQPRDPIGTPWLLHLALDKLHLYQSIVLEILSRSLFATSIL